MKYILSNRLYRRYTESTDADQILILCTIFSTSLLAFRVFYTGSPVFIFLFWNLFLAYIPFALSGRMEKKGRQQTTIRFLLSGLVWLLFIPNAFYIITDLFHLGISTDVPLWYDLALLLAFAWNGLLFGILSVRHMESMFRAYFCKTSELVFVLPVMALNGMGVYIGRYLRFNSWDVITDPFRLAVEILNLLIHPVQNRFDWSMIVCYTLLLTVIYFTFKKLGKEL